MNTLFKENIQEIIKFLKPKDCYHYTVTCKTYYNNFNIKQNVIDEINNRLLGIFGTKLNDFKSLLQRTGSFISGSFIIQCLLDEYWTNSDIDIYVPMLDNEVYYPSNMYMKTDVDNFMYYDMGFDGIYDGFELGAYRDKGTKINDCLKYVRNYITNKNYKIQIIGLNIDKSLSEMKQFVNETFDFPICKNIYYNDVKEYIVLNNVYHMVNKETVFQTGKIMSLTIKRYYKYKRNGFVFTNKDNLTYHDIITKHDRYQNYGYALSYVNRLSKDKNYINQNIFKCCRYKNYDTVEKFLGRSIIKIEHTSYDQYKCIPDECIINFIDSKINHIHYDSIIVLD